MIKETLTDHVTIIFTNKNVISYFFKVSFFVLLFLVICVCVFVLVYKLNLYN